MTMANHKHGGAAEMHYFGEGLEWPVAFASVLVWPVWSWADTLWQHFPTPTALYMAVSALFMLFQMSDKLGWLHRFKRRTLTEPPEKPDHE